MDHAIIIAAIVLVQTVAVAVINGIFSRDKKTREAEKQQAEERSILRAEESLLAMEIMSANISLSVEIVHALQEGRTNGKTASALIEAERAQSDYFAFINKIAAQKIGS